MKYGSWVLTLPALFGIMRAGFETDRHLCVEGAGKEAKGRWDEEDDHGARGWMAS